MGHIRRDLPDIFRRHGLEVVELDNWEENGHDGPFDAVGTMIHHTGSYDEIGDTRDDLSYAKWLAFKGRDDLPGPLCNIATSAEGVIYFCAGGRAYHAGRAKPSGTVAGGDGNTLYVGNEVMNDGRAPFTKKQYDAVVLSTALINIHQTGNSHNTDRGHKETSYTGKWDPNLDMDDFREDVRKKMLDLRNPDADKKTRIELFRDSRPRYNLKYLDDAVRDGRRGAVKRVRDGIVAQMNRLPDDKNPESLVELAKKDFEKNRRIRIGYLSKAVNNGRTGRVEDVRNKIIALIGDLPPR